MAKSRNIFIGSSLMWLVSVFESRLTALMPILNAVSQGAKTSRLWQLFCTVMGHIPTPNFELSLENKLEL